MASEVSFLVTAITCVVAVIGIARIEYFVCFGRCGDNVLESSVLIQDGRWASVMVEKQLLVWT